MKVWIDSVGNVVWEDPNNRDPLLIQLDSNTRLSWTHWLYDGIERENVDGLWMILE